jgi:hypothetical protein
LLLRQPECHVVRHESPDGWLGVMHISWLSFALILLAVSCEFCDFDQNAMSISAFQQGFFRSLTQSL